MVAEIPEGYSAAEVSPPRSVESEPQAELSSPEDQSQKEAPTKHLTVKISRDSVCQGEAGVY